MLKGKIRRGKQVHIVHRYKADTRRGTSACGFWSGRVELFPEKSVNCRECLHVESRTKSMREARAIS